ncbi:MAG TPA: hypothetical protein VFA67_02470 [Candidatus Sulfotelmatobacter sp.]|nr:hypothetical protein [Candidatus Sulfotelmatobacter sp.]
MTIDQIRAVIRMLWWPLPAKLQLRMGRNVAFHRSAVAAHEAMVRNERDNMEGSEISAELVKISRDYDARRRAGDGDGARKLREAVVYGAAKAAIENDEENAAQGAKRKMRGKIRIIEG